MLTWLEGATAFSGYFLIHNKSYVVSFIFKKTFLKLQIISEYFLSEFHT